MRYLLAKKMNALDIFVRNCLQKQFQWLECDWMKSRSTGSSVGSDLDQAGNASDEHTEGICPTSNNIFD